MYLVEVIFMGVWLVGVFANHHYSLDVISMLSMLVRYGYCYLLSKGVLKYR